MGKPGGRTESLKWAEWVASSNAAGAQLPGLLLFSFKPKREREKERFAALGEGEEAGQRERERERRWVGM